MEDEELLDKVWLIWESHGYYFHIKECVCGKTLGSVDEFEVHLALEIYKAGQRDPIDTET